MSARGLVLAVAVLQVGLGLPAAAATPGDAPVVGYVPPVPGAIIDPWRQPSGPFAAGNRGIDLAAEPGEVVRAAAAGEVVFAGAVAGSRHVVVLHPDGLRTTYAFLAATSVRRGETVVQGQPLGVAAGAVHFGVRAGEVYLDPTLLLFGEVRTHLVPVEDARRASEGEERNGLVRMLGGALRASRAAASWLAGAAEDGAEAGVDLVAWAAREGWAQVEAELESLLDTARLALHYLRLPVEIGLAFRRMNAYLADQAGCTPADRASPRISGRRIAVLVAGFGSDGRGDAIEDVDTRSLGYADSDVAQFSYAGGQVDGKRQLDGIPTTDGYAADRANGDLQASAETLRELLETIRLTNPGVPVDLIAHSQGGVVARAALADLGIPDPRLPQVANLVTIGSPHTGADLATGAVWLGTSTAGEMAAGVARTTIGFDESSPAAEQLAESSSFLSDLAGAHLRATRFTSIASAGDLLVTANHSAVDSAVNVLVPGGPGLGIHSGLPGTDAVEREIALALAGLGPTCRSLGGDIRQVVAISAAEDLVGAGLGLLGHYADVWLKAKDVSPVGGTGSPAPDGRR